MLIPSERHRPADLRLWAELESADLSHGNSPGLSRKIERSLEEIRKFTDNGPCYASVSWGKDSVAMAHMISKVAPFVPLVHLKAIPVGCPRNGDVEAAFLTTHEVVYREFDVDYRSIPPSLGPDEIERAKDRLFFARFRDAGSSFGARHLSGIRADESGGRKIRMRRWGLSSANACAPLGWWTTRDVFAYLATERLPVHPNYAMLGGGRWTRDRIRVDELGGARGDQFGRADWEREYYGDVLRRIEAM